MASEHSPADPNHIHNPAYDDSLCCGDCEKLDEGICTKLHDIRQESDRDAEDCEWFKPHNL